MQKCWEENGHKDTEQGDLVAFAIDCLQHADGAEASYDMWYRFEHGEQIIKVWDNHRKVYFPEILISPMFYYGINCNKQKQMKQFAEFFHSLLNDIIERNEDEKQFCLQEQIPL